MRRDIFPEMEGFMFATEGEAIPTYNYIQYIIKVPSIMFNLSHPSGSSSETIHHVIPSC